MGTDMRAQNFLFATRAPAATILVRLVVGAVFLSRGFKSSFLPMHSA